ncbi:MAG: flap endonuclease [Acidimicrobiales bacterium]|nr:flap endonuclease [Acidimicrobiales bacterium]
MKVHLVDGTYELFRHFFAVPTRLSVGVRPSDGQVDPLDIGAARGVVENMVRLLEGGSTHLGVATDHVIESWRNDLWPGYKTGAGIDPALRNQFDVLEDALAAFGITVWAMVEYEADDALGAAAAVAAADERVAQVQILTPDKDLAQCVRGERVVQVDRRKNVVLDEAGVLERYGVLPESIPDYLALVGDSADGFPGLAGFGAKSTAGVLRRYGHLTEIPAAPGQWDVPGVRGAAKLATTLQAGMADALLFRTLATLSIEGPEVGAVDDWQWRGPAADAADWARYLDAPNLLTRTQRLARARQG